jgi:hypothetical protein
MGYARSICEDKPVGDLTIIKWTDAADGGKLPYTFANDRSQATSPATTRTTSGTSVKED